MVESVYFFKPAWCGTHLAGLWPEQGLQPVTRATAFRRWFVTCLAVGSGLCAGALPADLQKEDLRSVQEAFRKADPSLDWFEASRKKPLDANRSVMIVMAAPTAMQPAGPKGLPARLPVQGKTEIGVFVVSGAANRVQLVLDLFPNDETKGFPSIDPGSANSVSLHFYSDYGIYEGSIKYFYDLPSGKPPVKFRYEMLALTSSRVRNGRIIYTGFSLDHGSEVSIEPRAGNVLPKYKITDVPGPAPETIREPVPLQLPDGRSVTISNTPPGHAHQPAGISVSGKSGARDFYPVPVPSVALDRRLRPKEQAPAEIENDIGPAVMEGSPLWFANRFYDGEGTSGVGAVGAFDVRTHKFEMRYLPEIAQWSGSAIRRDGDDLWIGLMRQPEGAAYSGGLLRYNPKTGSVAKYDIPDYIFTIDRLGDAIYCGTSNGLYIVRGAPVTQMRFEPDVAGRLVAVSAGRKPGGRAEALAPQK